MAEILNTLGNIAGTATKAATSALNPLALLGSAVGAVGSYFTNRQRMKFEQEEAEKQRTWNEQMMDKENAWSLDMWNRTNEYNSPSAQLQRMKEAGLNPLYYGLDGSSANGMQSAQALGYDRASAPNLENPLAGVASTYMQMQNAQKDLEMKEAQISKLKSETKAIDVKLPFEVDELRNSVRKSGLDADAQETINKFLDKQQEAEIRLKNANADEADAMVKRAVAEVEKMDYEKTTMYISWLETQERILNLQKQRELTDKQMEELASLINLNNKNAAKIGLDVANYDDITVIGNASHTMHFGPITVQEGQPITLAMKKAAQEHLDALKEESKKKNNKQNNQSYGLTSANSPYNGPIYD